MQWPTEGIPDNPRGWLLTVATRRLTDELRAEQARQRRESNVAALAVPDDAVIAGPDDDDPGRRMTRSRSCSCAAIQRCRRRRRSR